MFNGRAAIQGRPDSTFIQNINLRLALTGCPTFGNGAVSSLPGLAAPMFSRQKETMRLLADYLCPADWRIDHFLREYLYDTGLTMEWPKRIFVLDSPGLARAATDDGHADVAQLKRQLAGRLRAVMRGHARADHRHGVLVFCGQLALDVEHNRRIVNLLEQLGIMLVRLNDNVAAEFFDAFKFAFKVNAFFPVGNGASGFRPKAWDALQLGSIGVEDGGRVGEMLEQLACAHRADAINKIQSHQSFAVIHGPSKPLFGCNSKLKFPTELAACVFFIFFLVGFSQNHSDLFGFGSFWQAPMADISIFPLFPSLSRCRLSKNNERKRLV